jgi:hypothetical protein
VDVYTFVPGADQTLFLQDLGPSRSPALRVRLFGPGSSALAEASLDNYEENWFVNLQGGTTYFLVVDAFPYGPDWANVTGNYSFKLWEAPAATTSPLWLDSPVTGTIDALLGRDIFTFTGSAGQRLYVEDSSTDYPPLYLWIYQPDGGVLLWGDQLDDCDRRNPDGDTWDLNVFVLPETGTYRVEVRANRPSAEDVGSYSFTLWNARQPQAKSRSQARWIPTRSTPTAPRWGCSGI